MKIYFNASLLGKEKYLKEFKEIIKIFSELGHEVYSDHVMKRDYRRVNKQSGAQHETDYQKARREIQNSDVMIVEATYPSIGVGHTMTIALEMYKSVLILYQNQTTPHGLLIGNRLLTVKKYSLKNSEKLKQIIKTFLKKSEQHLLKKRFNFMLDKTQEDYLDWVAKIQRISKANFIRLLIDKDMRENKKFFNVSSLN